MGLRSRDAFEPLAERGGPQRPARGVRLRRAGSPKNGSLSEE